VSFPGRTVERAHFFAGFPNQHDAASPAVKVYGLGAALRLKNLSKFVQRDSLTESGLAAVHNHQQ
jgi:hypothetical protein